MKRILVITPTLGRSEFLDEVVAAVKQLPLFTHHLLSCPREMLARLKSRYPHCEVVPDAGKSGGIYGALNAGLVAVRVNWDWFTYINDDDLLYPRFADMVDAHLSSRGSEGVAYGNVGLIDEKGRLISQITIEGSPSWIPELLHEGISPLMQQGTLFSRATVRQLVSFDLRYRLCADLDFWLRAYVAKEGFKYYPMPVAAFRVRNGQLSGNTALTETEQNDIVRRHLPETIPELRRKIARFRYRFFNLPRYAQRIFRRGFQTSYQILQSEEAKP